MKAVFSIVFAVLMVKYTLAETCQEKSDRLLDEVRRGPNGMLPMGFHLPVCLNDGSYAPTQCMAGGCTCVSAAGVELVSFTRNIKGMDCLCARAKDKSKGLLGAEFNCNAENGNFLPKQCKGSVCYCVDPRGNQIGEALPRQDSGSLDC